MNYLDEKEAYGEVPDRFESAVANALRQEEKPMKRNIWKTALIAALVLVCLTATALAVNMMSLSVRGDVLQTARQAVIDKYGLTPETMGMFIGRPEETGAKTWEVNYTPIKYPHLPLGEYHVKIEDNTATNVTWTYDGEDLDALRTQGLEASAWGQAQLLQLIEIDHELYSNERNDKPYDEMTMEDFAALSAALEKIPGTENITRYSLPGPDDIQKDEALAMVKEAIMKTYGFTEEYYDNYKVHMQFRTAGDAGSEYIIDLNGSIADDDSQGSFHIFLHSPSGEMDTPRWFVKPEYFKLPDGDLSGYKFAVEWFMGEAEAFAPQTPAVKADLAKRFRDAGFGDLLDDANYVAPTDGDIAELDAAQAADKAMTDAYGFDDLLLERFSRTFALVEEDGKRMWRVDYAPVKNRDADFAVGLLDKYGTYTVDIAADTGDAINASWSFDDVKMAGPYDETNWASAPAFDSTILRYLIEFEKVILPLRDAMDEADLWSVEQMGEFDGLMRSVGFDADQYSNDLPREGEITQEEATKIAVARIEEVYGVELNDTDYYYVTYFMRDTRTDERVWVFSFQSRSTPNIYEIDILAETGEVVHEDYAAAGNG